MLTHAAIVRGETTDVILTESEAAALAYLRWRARNWEEGVYHWGNRSPETATLAELNAVFGEDDPERYWIGIAEIEVDPLRPAVRGAILEEVAVLTAQYMAAPRPEDVKRIQELLLALEIMHPMELHGPAKNEAGHG